MVITYYGYGGVESNLATGLPKGGGSVSAPHLTVSNDGRLNLASRSTEKRSKTPRSTKTLTQWRTEGINLTFEMIVITFVGILGNKQGRAISEGKLVGPGSSKLHRGFCQGRDNKRPTIL